MTGMVARSPDEEHRAATPLELFFDLVFVVAIAQASSILHHDLAEGHYYEALSNYGAIFFGIWWAWMNFTWFASAYDSDDVPYRIAVFVQMAGALILSAGGEGFIRGDLTLPVTGYIVMRLAMVFQWVRAGLSDRQRRKTAFTYAVGIAICQVGWTTLMFFPGILFPWGFVAMVIAELMVPLFAERFESTTWHAEHIAERYGLFTIIVLGESVLALSTGVQAAFVSQTFEAALLVPIAGGLLTILLMWWFYFDWPMHGLLRSLPFAFLWGYGHFLVFASAAAVGAGLAVLVDHQTGHSKISETAAAAVVAIPVAIYLVVLWLLHYPLKKGFRVSFIITPVAAGLTLLTILAGAWSPLLIGILFAAILTIKLNLRKRESVREA